MSEIFKSVPVDTTDGVSVTSVAYLLPEITKKEIKSVNNIFKINSVIKNIRIEGNKVWNTIKQFYSNGLEIPKNDIFEFKSDVQEIIIYSSGRLEFTAYGKYDNSTLTFEIEI